MPRPHQVPSISQVTRRNQEKQEKEKKRRKLNSKRSRASNQYQQWRPGVHESWIMTSRSSLLVLIWSSWPFAVEFSSFFSVKKEWYTVLSITTQLFFFSFDVMPNTKMNTAGLSARLLGILPASVEYTIIYTIIYSSSAIYWFFQHQFPAYMIWYMAAKHETESQLRSQLWRILNHFTSVQPNQKST